MIGYLIENTFSYNIKQQRKKMKLFNGCTVSNDNDVLSFLSKVSERDMKFDYIIQNPPYSTVSDKNIHIKFLERGYNLLSSSGKMIIIEPATLYLDIRDNISSGAATKRFKPIKEVIKNNVYKVVIDNYNKEFNINSFQQFAITYLDKSTLSNSIEYIIYGEKRIVDNIYDCNYIGDRTIIDSIIYKCLQYKNMAIDHVYEAGKPICNTYNYLRYSYLRTMNGPQSEVDYQLTPFGSFYNYNPLVVHKDKVIMDKPTTYCYYGTTNELENFTYFAYNNKLPVFLSIILTYGRHNNVLPYIPWICDKQYTDQEIYDLLNFNNKEINLLEKCIKLYEKKSPIFLRYMGVSVSDEEVQKFIDELENEYK